MKVLITFALANEFAPWRKLRPFRSQELGGADSFVADIGGAQVHVVLTGVGTKNAGDAASAVIGSESESLGFCVSAGLAGALRPAYGIGQVLVARAVAPPVPQGGGAGSEILCSEALVAFATEHGATAVDRFHTSGRVIARAEEKRHLGQSADAVEMESFEILKEAGASGIPAVAIRAISDTANEELPLDMSRIFGDRGQVSLSGVVAEVARHPKSLPGLLKLGQQSKLAAESLAHFLDRYVLSVIERSRDLHVSAAVAS